MFCTACGKNLSDSAKFCPYCGAQIQQQKIDRICPACGWSTTEDKVYCGECGMRLQDRDQLPPAPGSDKLLHVSKLWSVYDGSPTFALSRAMGTLRLYEDRIEFQKVLGNSIGSAFGLIGIAVARSKIKEEPAETIRIQNITKVDVGKYAKTFNTLYLESTDHDPVTLVPPIPASSEPELLVIKIKQLMQ